MEREVGGRLKREGTDVYLWLIHVDVWQESSQYCKIIILQLKIKNLRRYALLFIQCLIFKHRLIVMQGYTHAHLQYGILLSR